VTYNNNKDPITFKQDLVAMLVMLILVPSFIWALITAPLVVAATLATNWTVGLYIFFHFKRKAKIKAEVEEWKRQQDAFNAHMEEEHGPDRDKEIRKGLVDDDDSLVFASTEEEMLEDLTEEDEATNRSWVDIGRRRASREESSIRSPFID